MNRRDARITAFCLLFESDFHPECSFDEIYERAEAVGELKVNNFCKAIFENAVLHKEEIDAQIEATSNKWKISRFSAVARAIIRTAVAEMMFTDVPAKVAINEAVELAKKFGQEESPAFINGVLAKLAS